MEFITMVHPSQGGSAKLKRQAHSHAARVAHARARRLRVAEYVRKKKNAKQSEQPGEVETLRETQEIVAPLTYKQDLTGHPEVTQSIPQLLSTAFEHEPLASFLVSLTYRERFMFDYYVRVFAPQMQANCPVLKSLGEFQENMRQNWVIMSSTDTELLHSFLLAACRDLSITRLQKEYTEFAIEYKLRYVQKLRQTISVQDLSSSRTAVTRALVLAFDDIMLQDTTMAAKHVLGAVHIIKAAGGLQALGLSDIVRGILYSCIYGKSLFQDPDLIWK